MKNAQGTDLYQLSGLGLLLVDSVPRMTKNYPEAALELIPKMSRPEDLLDFFLSIPDDAFLPSVLSSFPKKWRENDSVRRRLLVRARLILELPKGSVFKYEPTGSIQCPVLLVRTSEEERRSFFTLMTRNLAEKNTLFQPSPYYALEQYTRAQLTRELVKSSHFDFFSDGHLDYLTHICRKN